VSMPPELVRAHQSVDRAVDAAYGKKEFKAEVDRVAFLFELYNGIAAPLDVRAPGQSRRRVRDLKRSVDVS
jgi:hypothetical protein